MNLLDANDPGGGYPAGWYRATASELPPFPPLRGETRADVCIVGGGYTGLSAALTLRAQGRDVVLLDAQRVGFGASGRNGGQVGSGQRLDQGTLEKIAGRDAALRLWQIAEDAKAEVARLIRDHGIDAHWRPGIAHASYRAGDLAHEVAETERLRRDYGYDRIEVLDRAGIARLTGSAAFSGGTLDHGAGHIHPLRLAVGLAWAADRFGVRIHEGSRSTALSPGWVTTPSGRVRAETTLLATNGYLGTLEPRIAARVMPLNNFIVATQPLDRHPEILPTDAAVADSRFVVNYWRRGADNRLLFGGGESYGYRFPADIAAKVRPPLLSIYPQLKGVRIDHAWGGTLAITMRRMPLFARPRPDLWSAGGYSGHGVAMAVMAGRILAEAICGQTGRYDTMAALPAPAFPGGAALRSPLLALAMTWYGLRDRLGL